MTKKILFTAVSAIGLLTAMSAQAQDDTGWYLRGNMGYGMHGDVDIIESINGDVESEGNVAGSLGVGYQFDDNWRVELDGTSLWTDMGAIQQLPNSSAKLRTNALMINAIYDFDAFGERWKPYLGAGVGYMKGKANLSAHDFLDASGTNLIRSAACIAPRVANVGSTCNVDDSSGGLAWQGLAGLGYKISDNLTWDTHYKFTDAEPFEFNGTSQSGLSGPTSPLHLVKMDPSVHTLMTGFRYRFGASAPKAAPVAPMPPPTPDYKASASTSASSDL